MHRALLILACCAGVLAIGGQLPAASGPAPNITLAGLQTSQQLEIGDSVHGYIGPDSTHRYTILSDTGAYALLSVTLPEGAEHYSGELYFEGSGESRWFYLPLSRTLPVFLGADSTYTLAVRSGGGAFDYTLELLPLTGYTREVEANDAVEEAMPIVLGDPVLGARPPQDSIDFFTFSAEAGQILAVEVIAQVGRTPPVVSLALITPDGVFHGSISSTAIAAYYTARVLYTSSVAGPLHAAVQSTFWWGLGDRSSASAFAVYRIRAEVVPPGPGDPTTIVWDGALDPERMAVGLRGEVYILGGQPRRILRWDSAGSTLFYQDDSAPPQDMAVHPTGDLLIVAGEAYSAESQVLRLSETGTVSVVRELGATRGGEYRIVVGPDGGPCLGSWAGIECFGMDGTFLSELVWGLEGVISDMAFSPSGVLHFVRERPTMDGAGGGWTVEKLGGGSRGHETVFTIPGDELHSLAFDAEGRLYVGTRSHGVRRVEPGDEAPGEFVAGYNLGTATALAFGRTADGTATRDLLAVNRDRGLIVRLNSEGIPAPGAPLQPDFDGLVAAVFGEDGAVTPEEAQWADQMGNGNGRLDVGDLAALVQGGWVMLSGSHSREYPSAGTP